jgi:hypothetical protein
MEYITARAQPTPKKKPTKKPATVAKETLILHLMVRHSVSGEGLVFGKVFADPKRDNARREDDSDERKSEKEIMHTVQLIGTKIVHNLVSRGGCRYGHNTLVE